MTTYDPSDRQHTPIMECLSMQAKEVVPFGQLRTGR
jgi:hypothetical protein